MISITGKLPRSIVDSLNKMNVVISDVQIVGDDIDVTLTADNDISSTLYAIFVGNGKWVIDELDDAANLFPEIEEGDSVSADMFTKLFINSINSSLILSFNPLGEVKYGIKDKIDNLKEKARRVKDWANNTLYAEDAEKWIRGNGPYRRTFTDARDGQTRTKKDYSASRINVGKIQQLGDEGKGHYKVLTGNPATQDFQVWHLYKNGNKIRCLDVKTGLKPQEAQWVYDNNIPDSWSEADWNPEGEIPQKASKIEVGETQEPKNQTEESQTEETTEEDNVTETEEVQETNGTENEEDNVTEIDDMDPDTWFEEDNTHEAVTEEEDNVIEEPKKKKKKVAASLVKSSIEDSDSDFGGDVEEDNVIESKPNKKSKYNGCNVTGCTESDGSVALASGFIRSCLILSTIDEFQQKIREYKLGEEPKKFLMEILTLLSKLPKKDRLAITENSGDNMLCFNFGKSDLTTENYNAEFKIFEDKVVGQDINMGNGQKIKGTEAAQMCINTLKSMIP